MTFIFVAIQKLSVGGSFMLRLNAETFEFEPIVGLDIETTGLSYRKDQVVTIAIQSGIDSYVWQVEKFSKEFIAKVLSSIQLAVIHSVKFDLGFLRHNYGVIPPFYCTLMASKILTNGNGFDNDLTSCLAKYLSLIDPAHENKDEIRTEFKVGELSQEQLDYIVADVAHLIPLKTELEKRITADALDKVMKLEHKLLPILLSMEAGGIRFDTEKLKHYIRLWGWALDNLTVKMEKVLDRLYADDGYYFEGINYNSPKQVMSIFTDIGEKIPVLRKGKVLKDSVGYDALQEWVNRHPGHKLERFIQLLLRHRELAKLVSTYGIKLLKKVENGKLHGEYNQMGALTSRLSSSRPNLQNIPAEGTGARLRRCFLPDEGHDMVTCDMAGAEIRIAADYSGDKLLIESITKGVDMHSKIATTVFSIILGEPYEITKNKEPVMVKGQRIIPNDFRTAQKNVTFAKFYKCGVQKLESMLIKYLLMYKCPKGTAGIISKAIDDQLGGLTAYLTDVISKANEYHYLRGEKFGRIRYFPKGAFGDAANNPIQLVNAEAIKVAMINVDKYLRQYNCGRILLSVHDELVCSVPKEYSKVVAEKIKQIMSESLSYFLRTLKGDAEYTIWSHWKK